MPVTRAVSAVKNVKRTARYRLLRLQIMWHISITISVRTADCVKKIVRGSVLFDTYGLFRSKAGIIIYLKGRPPCGMIERRLWELLFGAVPEKRSLV